MREEKKKLKIKNKEEEIFFYFLKNLKRNLGFFPPIQKNEIISNEEPNEEWILFECCNQTMFLHLPIVFQQK